jgi:pimeloyl-ACP methyl ester carboxylesterase
MFNAFKKLAYGVRVLLAKGNGQPETHDVNGRATVLMHAGDGPAFVYLHSSLGESSLWLPFYQTWAKRFHVFVPTHPGFGASGGFEQIDSIEDMAFHYVELFDALGIGEVILGGVSLGGWIAAEFASRWPERVKKLWIADAPGLWTDRAQLGDLFRVMTDRDKLREMLFHDPKGAMATLVIKDQADEATLMTAYQNMTTLARLVWERPYNPKLAARLRRVQCPTLLLWGEHDRLIPPAFGEAYQAALPHARLEIIKNCGHLPMFEKESEFAAKIAAFAAE